jgi:hypothetical protein
LGGQQLPSAFYKLRMVPIKPLGGQADAAAIRGLDIGTG